MTVFFLVVGLEARREFDLGELRERRRLVLPLLAAVGGMAAAVAIYLAFNPSGTSAAGWGIAMSNDTALALGLLAVAAPRAQQRLRAFVLTVLVVNDLVALAVIALVYSHDVDLTAFAWAAAFVATIVALRALRVRTSIPYVLLGLAGWVALLASGVEPVVLGLALGLLVGARPVGRPELRRVAECFRRFREQPTPRLECSARRGLRSALPPNERLLALCHPWTSYAIVPVFALANVGIVIDSEVLRRAAGSPVTIGLLLGFLVGKPIGMFGISLAVTRLSRAAYARRSAGRQSSARARSPASASPCPCWWPASPSLEPVFVLRLSSFPSSWRSEANRRRSARSRGSRRPRVCREREQSRLVPGLRRDSVARPAGAQRLSVRSCSVPLLPKGK